MGINYVINTFVEETNINQSVSYVGMFKTLKSIIHNVKGTHCSWTGIRKEGKIVAEVETNWRGEISEIFVHSPISSHIASVNPGFWKFQ